MYTVLKVTTMRGEVYTFGGPDDAVRTRFSDDNQVVVVVKNSVEIALFPTRNVESIAYCPAIDGEVAS